MKRLCVSFILFALIPVSLAHNTNVTHPVLTLEAIRLIKEQDTNGYAKYEELYRGANVDFTGFNYDGITEYPFYWGVWNTRSWSLEPNERLYEDIDTADKDDPILGAIVGLAYSTIFESNDSTIISSIIGDRPRLK